MGSSFSSVGFFAARTAMRRKRREETTPLKSPASVPMVTVKTQQTTKAPKSAQLVLLRGPSSRNWAKREKRLTMTMAAWEALGMNLMTSVRT